MWPIEEHRVIEERCGCGVASAIISQRLSAGQARGGENFTRANAFSAVERGSVVPTTSILDLPQLYTQLSAPQSQLLDDTACLERAMPLLL